MQNSNINRKEFKQNPFRHFCKKLKIAFNVLTAEKSIVIINDHTESFNLEPEKVMGICGKICISIKESQEQKDLLLHDELLSQAINRLVYN